MYNYRWILYGIMIIIIVLLCYVITKIILSNKYNQKNAKNNKKSKNNNNTLNKKERFVGGSSSSGMNSEKYKKKINVLKDLCNMPQTENGGQSTGHCFADGTHHTCCMLGNRTRESPDVKNNNPIGEPSIDVYLKKKGMTRSQFDKIKHKTPTPWCTCFGSEVCSQYKKKFGDDTNIAFINNPFDDTEIVVDVPYECEGYFRDKFKVRQHGTPGVASASSQIPDNIITKCERHYTKNKKDVFKYAKSLKNLKR